MLISSLLVFSCNNDGNGTPVDGGSDAQAEMEPVAIFLMAGQSNMEGYGPIAKTERGDWPLSGSLEELIASGEEPATISDKHSDVWVTIGRGDNVHPPGLLEPGFGENTLFIGPELGFGEILGENLKQPLVLYKFAKGGSTLGKDWRPPSAGGTIGQLYQTMISSFKEFLSNDIDSTFEQEIQARGYRVEGFIWLQGWNDQFEDGFVAEYQENLVSLIRDLRSDLQLPNLPAIIVEGPTLEEALRQARTAAINQLKEDSNARVLFVETEDLVTEEIEGNFHFHFNAKNYLEVGRRTAKEYLK